MERLDASSSAGSLRGADQGNDLAGQKAGQKRTGPDKLIYLKRMAEFDRLIEICTSKLQSNPANDRALMIRASSLMKKGALRWEFREATPMVRAKK
jgi:hypothetical protein